MFFYYAWEQRKLSEVAEIVGGGTPSTNIPEYWDGDIDWYAPAEINDQIYVDGSERKITKLGLEKSSAKILPADKTVLFTSRAGIGKTAILRRSGTTNQGFQSMVLNDETNPYFVFSMSKFIKEEAERVASGSTFAEVSGKMLGNLAFMFPTKKEQDKIGEYFSNLDNLITLHQRKCDQTKKLKKYMLQKMFPQNGELYPEIRFEGFTNAWKQCKLSDAIEKLTGGASIAPEDYTEEGYRTIPKGAVNDSGVADMSGCKYVSGTFFAKNSTSKTSAGELVTSLRDLVPTAPNIGRIVRIYGDSEEFLMPQGVYSIKVKDNVSEDFLITYSNSPIYRKIIMAEKNGSTQVHIRNGEFLNIDFPMPSCDEQNKIGSYFRNLNNLITLHQRKRDELMKIKKYMLQNMFAM